ncbi:protein kinase domain-containing protein [Streptomyces graminilatus]|uniref:protein kinase domain-containing protein n=1 Tax=Streptomyces graminilatus TaxID=1464070 RepID=UPI0006E1669B|nr:protein kinase [Streptomyces graminilatus]
MDDYPIGRLLGGRYRLPADDGLDTIITDGLDTLSGHQVQLTRIALPETLAADPRAYSPSNTVPSGDQEPDGPVRRACEAVRALTLLPDHPHLVQVFDVLMDGSAMWIVSEYVAARPLSALLARAPLTPSRAAEIAREVLHGVRALHARGWLHRNITEHTVLICENGSVLMSGLAQSVAEEALCGYAPRPLPHACADEAAQRAPGGLPDTAAESGKQTEPSRTLPARTAGGGWAALRADAQRQAAASTPLTPSPLAKAGPDQTARPADRCDTGEDFHCPVTALEAQRARDTRIMRVDAVTERWAPEQAAPVGETWHLAPPLGPSVDLWALGALLFRALQGHPPFPEDDVAELLAMVCTEPPAFAEDSGEMRAIIESLLRQDPAQRLSLDEAEGWLRSLVRHARELVPAPPSRSLEAPRGRLPVLRLRGHLVRRRSPAPVDVRQGRHRRTRAAPRLRGRTLLVVTALPLALGATAYAVLALSQSGSADAPDDAAASPRPSAHREATPPPTPAPEPADGDVRHDPAGFQIAVGDGWKRHLDAAQSRVRFTRGGLTLIVVPGRDTVSEHDSDPLSYQKTEPELAPYRADPEGTATGVRRIDIGQDISLAEGQYSFTDAAGTQFYARNQALVADGRYHIVFVQGPAAQRELITRVFNQAVATYWPTDAQQ